MTQRSAGWYADPVTIGAARYWDGRAWSDLVSWGGRIQRDPTPLATVERRAAEHDSATIATYLEQAVARQLISREVAGRLLDDLGRVATPPAQLAPAPAVVAAPAAAVPAKQVASGVRAVGGPLPAPTPPATVAPSDAMISSVPAAEVPIKRVAPEASREAGPLAAPVAPWPAAPAVVVPARLLAPEPRHEGGPLAVPTPPPVRSSAPELTLDVRTEPAPSVPGLVARWWLATRSAVHTDLALHWLAYLGVLLMFAGVTGLIVFSFGEVAPWVRTFTELLVPISLFLAGWYLSRRGAGVVGAALTLLGGAVLPIVTVASLTDGSPIPPDMTGRSLALAQATACVLLAVAMGYAVMRAAYSPLRFVCAPLVWLAAGLAAGALRDSAPSGYDVARFDALQLAVMSAALTATAVVLAWRRPTAAWASSTELVAVPFAAGLYTVEVILAGVEGWPIASTLVAGVSSLVLVEALSRRLVPAVAMLAQIGLTGVLWARLATRWEPAWIAALAALTLIALVEYGGWRRPTRLASAVGLGASAIAAAASLAVAGPGALAAGALGGWALWRRMRPAHWMPFHDRFGVVVASALTVATIEIWRLVEDGTALVTTAGVVLAFALAGRAWGRVGSDPLWIWAVPTAAATVAVAASGIPWGDEPWACFAATAMAASSMALSVVPIPPRTWVGGAIAMWSLAHLGHALEVGAGVRAATLAGIAALLVCLAATRGSALAVHLAMVGHVSGIVAMLAVAWPGWPAAVVVASAAAAWLVVGVVDERREAAHLAWLRRASRGGSWWAVALDQVAPLATLASAATAVTLAAEAGGLVTFGEAWPATVVAGVVLVAAVAARSISWRRASPLVIAWVLTGLALAAAVVAFALGPEQTDWAPVTTIAIGLAVVLLNAPRPEGTAWLGWAESAALAVAFTDRCGLDRRWDDVVLAGWGAAVLIACLAVARAVGHDAAIAVIERTHWMMAPVTFGTVALISGGLAGLTDGTRDEIGWTAAGLSIPVVTIAVLVSLGAIGAGGELLAVSAYVLLAPWDPIDRPLTIVPAAVVLLVLARMVRTTTTTSRLARWDVSTFVAAHVVAFVALAVAIDVDQVAVTFAAVAAVAIAVSAVLRAWPWAVAGAVLAVVAGVDAGSGWLALTLAVEGGAWTVVGLQRTGWVRWLLVGVGAGALAGSWFAFVDWRSFTDSTVFYVTVPAASVLALVAMVALRVWDRVRELAIVWAVTGSVMAACSVAVGADAVDRAAGGYTVAAALLVLAAAAAIAAPVLGAVLRWVSAALTALTWAPLAIAVEPSPTSFAGFASVVALASVAALVAGTVRRPTWRWAAPVAMFAVLTQMAATVVAVGALPTRSGLVVALLAVAAELVGLGSTFHVQELYVASPPTGLAALMTFAGDALRGDANWITLPIGVTLLVMVAVMRWIRGQRGSDRSGHDVVALELVGMSFMVGSALAQTLVGELWNAPLAIGVGVLLTGWGIVTRVRWRAEFGSTAVLLAVLLLIAVPIANSGGDDGAVWRGPLLWIVIASAGLTAILVALAIERGRDRLHQIAQRLEEMTAGWERVELRSSRPHGSHRGGLRGA